MASAKRRSPRCSHNEPPPGLPSLCQRRRRPRAEDCDRLTAAGLRPLLETDASHYRLADGTTLKLLWVPVRGGFGDGGMALGVACPGCSARVTVLRRPPGEGWSCWRCRPVSHPSHRRSGNSKGKSKPRTWQLDRILTEQRQIVGLLGFAVWPPARLFWNSRDLEAIPRLSKAPRFSPNRRLALMQRLDALESLRLATLLPAVRREIERLGGDPAKPLPPFNWVAQAERTLTETSWAMRRQGHDPRTLRKREALRPEPFDQATGGGGGQAG